MTVVDGGLGRSLRQGSRIRMLGGIGIAMKAVKSMIDGLVGSRCKGLQEIPQTRGMHEVVDIQKRDDVRRQGAGRSVPIRCGV
jgi:hypothetical protein